MNQNIALLQQFNKNIIAYNPIYAQISGNTKSGLLLSQLMYWWQITDGKEFYKTQTELQTETILSIDEIKSALTKLKLLGFISSKLKGLPARNYFTINVDKIYETIETNINKEQL